MMSFTNPNTETQTALEIDLTKPIADIVATEEVKTSETPKWDGRGIRLNTREEFIEYVADRVRNELVREVYDHAGSNKVSEKDIDLVLGKNFSFVTKNVPKEENFPVTINPGFHNSSLVYANKRTPFHRGDRFLSAIKQVARDILFLLEADETGAFKVVELEEEGKGTIETFFIYSTKGENLPLVTEKPKKEPKAPKPKTALEEAFGEAGIKKSPAPRKEKEVKASKPKSGIKPTVTIKGNEVVVRIPEGFSVVVETV
jgi:hypothetical protein|nr:MAG TPA: hypothetical protein [Caudoviricetes sp.]